LKFVSEIVAARPRRLTWDLGCNTGVFSRILATHSDYVVSFDIDELSIDRLYRSCKKEGPKNILPLVFDLTNPSPPLGWRCRERQDIENRSRPELIVCLALLHHLIITGNIPLVSILEWLATFDCEIVVEMLSKEDEMVQTLLLNRTDQYD